MIRFTPFSKQPLLVFFSLICFGNVQSQIPVQPNFNAPADLNGDSAIHILVLGTNSGINGTEHFSPDLIAEELLNILSQDEAIGQEIHVGAEDIYTNKNITIGLGGGGSEFNYVHHRHSLVQYYHWPENRDERLANLQGLQDYDWDYVVIAADPHILGNLPGFYALGVNLIADKISQGAAQALLLLMWPDESESTSSMADFEEFTYRTAEHARVNLPVVPAGIAWANLPADKKDDTAIHPSPNGAYLSAASIYSHIFNRPASASNYFYDDDIAALAEETVMEESSIYHHYGLRTFLSPYSGCKIEDSVINYNHTGTSSERGILNGLRWVFNKAPQQLQNGGPSPIDFNYGRANNNFEANKRYQVDPTRFDFSFGFPMQDHRNHGVNSMLYGLDRRSSGTINDTDLGVARYMIQNDELPYARALPIRTLNVLMKDVIEGHNGYRDNWHMSNDLDKASGAFMYTILTGDCVLEEEPADSTSNAWKSWMAHKIGYETAWTFMHLEGQAQACNSLSVDVSSEPMTGGTALGSGTFLHGETAQLNATSESSYNFIHWTVDGKILSDDPDFSFQVTKDIQIVAHFKLVSNNKKTNLQELRVYPNPAKDFVQFHGLDGNCQIINANGSMIWRGQIKSNSKIDITNFPAGIYLVKTDEKHLKFLVSD